MNFNELGTFSKKLSWAASVQSKSIGEFEAKNMFEFVQDLPLEAVLQGIERALRKGDPDDLYEKSTLLTGPEIRRATEEIIEKKRPEEETGSVSSCKVCDGMGWITGGGEKGRIVSWPCRCLYESARKTLAKKQRPTAAAEETRKCCKNIVAAYEYHQKKWGTGPEEKES